MLFISVVLVRGQEIYIDAEEEQLNKILVDIRNRYDVQFSYDDQLLSNYSVTLKDMFPDAEKAVKALISDFPLGYEKSGDVFIIYYFEKTGKKVTYRVSGQILETGSRVPLPFSHVIINNKGIVTDLKGTFSFISSEDSLFNIRASYLGYYIIDTVVSPGNKYQFFLTPSSIGLSEIIIEEKIIEKSIQIGNTSGLMKLNHKIANFLPGFGDNSVFNLLRLQPGILAAGEQTNEMIIWGSYAGHSQVLFDGFTIYGLKNFNDNISAFNPLMAKDIEVFKGGYDAKLGGRVGGIVNISGKNGNREKTSFTFNINNMTLNGSLEVPLFGNSSFLLAFRQTYYNLYDPEQLYFGRDDNQSEINVIPDYQFRDINLKYSATFKNSDLFYVSLYGGNDQFQYNIDEELYFRRLIKRTEEKNVQSGGAVYYGKTWKEGNTSDVRISFSKLRLQFSDQFRFDKLLINETDFKSDEVTENSIAEASIQFNNRFAVAESHLFEGGFGLIMNNVYLHEDTFNVTQASLEAQSGRLNLYFQDKFFLGNHGHVKAGFRVYYTYNLQKAFIDPRLSSSFNLGDFWKMNFAWGKYHQFISKSSVVDELGNYRYLWTLCDNVEVPVLEASHFVWGLSYFRNDFTLNLEAYHKTTSGLTRFVRFNALDFEDIFQGDSRSYGIDVLLKKDFIGHSGWIAYTLGKTQEHFSYFNSDEYRRAPHDQRHEVKLALLFNFDPFYLSANYVFGSGFPEYASYIPGEKPDNLTYSRMDFSFIYKFSDRKLKGEIGFTILNVLNTENIKYTNFERIPSYQTNSISIYAESIPFTPALFLKIWM